MPLSFDNSKANEQFFYFHYLFVNTVEEKQIYYIKICAYNIKYNVFNYLNVKKTNRDFRIINFAPSIQIKNMDIYYLI